MLDTRSNMRLADLKSKSHGGQSLRDLIYFLISARLYPPPGYDHNTLLCLDNIHGPACHQANLCDDPNTKNEVYNVLHKNFVGKLCNFNHYFH